MKHSFKEQIDAIQEVRRQVNMTSKFDSALNDAASTIAALNLTKDIKKVCHINKVGQLWEMRVEGKTFHFVGDEHAKFYATVFNVIGYDVRFIDSNNL